MFQTVRGTFDVLPEPQETGGAYVPGSAAWRHAEGVVRAVMARFRFEEVRTPILEPLALIARGVGATTDIVQKEMFVVAREDEGGSGGSLVLRPEVTAPVMRAYLQHRLDQKGGPQRLYYVGPCFRAERPQKGRFRQFHQFGVELLGAAGPAADAEAIANMRAVYDAFGVTGTRLRLNTLGGAETRPRYREALRAYFEPFRADLSETSRQRLETNPLRLLDTKDERERRLLDGAPRLSDFVAGEARAHHDELKALLDAVGIPYVEDPLLVRGIDYYTGAVFELESDALGAQSALAAGGRYDGLAESVGGKQRTDGRPSVPAVGYAAGIERLFLTLRAAGYRFPDEAAPDAYVVALPGGAATAFALAHRLRAAGLAVAQTVEAGSFKRLMKDADRSGARRYVFVGEDEAARGVAQVKDAATGERTEVAFDALAEALRAGGAEARVSDPSNP
jgi:histidyl-tRNA synthetase